MQSARSEYRKLDEMFNPQDVLTKGGRIKDTGGAFLQTQTGNTQRTATSPVERYTEKLNYRLRGRSFALRIDSSSLGTKYKLGTPRASIREDGRR